MLPIYLLSPMSTPQRLKYASAKTPATQMVIVPPAELCLQISECEVGRVGICTRCLAREDRSGLGAAGLLR